MKIAFLSFYQQVMQRGVENWLEQLSQRLGREIEVKVFSPFQVNLKQFDYSSSFWRRFFLDPSSRAIFSFTLSIFSQLKGFDIIVALNGGWQTWLAKIASVIYRKKLVLVGQAGLGYDERWNLLWRPDLFIALTHVQAQWAKKYYSGPIKIIPNAVDLNQFKPEGRQLSFELKHPRVLCAASLQKKEFFKNLIQAVANTKASLIMAASFTPEQKKPIEDWCKHYLKGKFLIKNFSYKQMPLLYRSVDLFVYPNPFWESFGIVFLEAMASNLAVIASDDSIRQEIIGQAGLLIDPNSPQSIKEAIEQSLQMNWGNKPREQAKKFAWQKIAKQYEQVFKKLLGKE